MRLQASIFTDKVVYRPNDVIFGEIFVLDAFNKTPTALIDPSVILFFFLVKIEILSTIGETLVY